MKLTNIFYLWIESLKLSDIEHNMYKTATIVCHTVHIRSKLFIKICLALGL